jgi:RND family efflux transporter MFP subunit
MKRKAIIILILIIVAAVITYTLSSNKKIIDSRKEVKTIEHLVAVNVANVEWRGIDGELQFVGITEATKEVMVGAEASGKIVKINFKLGDYVNAGVVLAEVDATYRQLTYENAKLNYDKFKEDLERFQNLRKGDAVTETQLRDIRIGFENATIQLEQAKKQLEDTKIVAPFSGYITSRNTELGAWVNVGTPIAGIADISQLKVVFVVSESNVYELSKGQSVSVTTDIYSEVVYNGTISNISPKGTQAHTYPIEITIPNNNRNAPLKAGTYVNVSVNNTKTGKVLMIPRDAIISSIKEPSVYVVEGESVRLTRIFLGKNYNTHLEVVSGLKEGEKVVINGQINLTDGSKVIVAEN